MWHCFIDISSLCSLIHDVLHIIFFKSPAAKPNVQFRASVDGMPDLPKWLLLEQRSPLHPAFLYGTPTVKDVGEVYLEVVTILQAIHFSLKLYKLLYR